MAGKKVYAVRVGQQPGIYQTWDETKAQVMGFPGAQYKGFATRAEAEAYLNGANGVSKTKTVSKHNAAPSNATITVYTDGGSRNHGNVAGGHVKTTDPAAWAYWIKWSTDALSGSDGEFGATNNRMEIMALLEALKTLVARGDNEETINVVTDSKYVLQAITEGWLAGWKRRGWKRSSGELANKELWQEIDRLLPKFPHLNFSWTKGHATNEGNVYVDRLLNETMDQMQKTGKAGAIQQTGMVTPATETTEKKPEPPVASDEVRQRSIDAIRKALDDMNN